MATVRQKSNLVPEDLYRNGFTEAQIAKLSRLRDRYPYWEFVESQREWDYLLFARWEYHHGHRRK